MVAQSGTCAHPCGLEAGGWDWKRGGSDEQTKTALSVLKLKHSWDFPGGTVVKNPTANAGDTGSSPGPGRSHMPWSN